MLLGWELTLHHAWRAVAVHGGTRFPGVDFGKFCEPGIQLGVVEGVGWGEEEEPAGEAAHANGACWCMCSCLW